MVNTFSHKKSWDTGRSDKCTSDASGCSLKSENMTNQ